MPQIDAEIRRAIAQITESIIELGNRDVVASRRNVCISTRLAEATFDRVTRWSGQIDPLAQKALIEALKDALKSLEELTIEAADADTPAYIDSIRNRVEEVKRIRVREPRISILPQLQPT